MAQAGASCTELHRLRTPALNGSDVYKALGPNPISGSHEPSKRLCAGCSQALFSVLQAWSRICSRKNSLGQAIGVLQACLSIPGAFEESDLSLRQPAKGFVAEDRLTTVRVARADLRDTRESKVFSTIMARGGWHALVEVLHIRAITRKQDERRTQLPKTLDRGMIE